MAKRKADASPKAIAAKRIRTGSGDQTLESCSTNEIGHVSLIPHGRADTIANYPAIDEFSQALSEASEWYTMGVFLAVPTHVLDEISHGYGSHGRRRCLIEMYKDLERRQKVPSWDDISKALRRLKNNSLADKIDMTHSSRKPSLQHQSLSISSECGSSMSISDVSVAGSLADYIDGQLEIIDEEHAIVSESITGTFQKLTEQFSLLILELENACKTSLVPTVSDLQLIIRSQYKVVPLTGDDATFENVFSRLCQFCCVLNYRILEFLAEKYFGKDESLMEQLSGYRKNVDAFKSSSEMRELMQVLKKQTNIPLRAKIVKLKVREFWNDITMKEFEKVIKKIMLKVYMCGSQVTVGEGCVAVSWVVPDQAVDKSDLLNEGSETFKIIGIISLHIDDEVVYDLQSEGCETIEAAMLQAIELKNSRAIELLLDMGCNLEVATCNGNNAVTNIVNIRENEIPSDASSSVDHVCVLDHNEHVEAILDPDGYVIDCTYCKTNEEIVHKLYHEVDTLRNSIKEQDAIWVKEMTRKENQVEELKCLLLKEQKDKDAQTQLLRNQNYELVKRLNRKDKELVESLPSQSQLKQISTDGEKWLPDAYETTSKNINRALIQRRLLGIRAEMRIKVIVSGYGNSVDDGGTIIKASLTCNKKECPVVDKDDNIYTVSVIPQQLGQHQLSITVNDQHVQDSPFSITIVPQRDYTQLKDPIQIITGINTPSYIAFSDNGDMFVTSSGDHCIHVYDKSGNRKSTIGSKGDGKLQFNEPCGIDVDGDYVYVTERQGHRIHKLTTTGDFVGVYANRGTEVGQLRYPFDIKVGPNGSVYVADDYNTRVQLFSPDMTPYRIIDGKVSGGGRFSRPEGIAFDLSGDLHVTGYGSSSVTVFDPHWGQLVRSYDKMHISFPTGIAIDSSGFSLVVSWDKGSLLVFDRKGNFVGSVMGGFSQAFGVAVSPADGSVWVADSGNNRLLKF